MARKSFPSRRARPRYQWIREAPLATTLSDNTVNGVMSVSDSEILAEGLAAPTLVRIRGTVLLTADFATAVASNIQRVGIGIIVVPSTVTAAEVGGPIAEPNLSWMYWTVRQIRVPDDITDPGLTSAPPGMDRFDFDVKAMRKIHKSTVHFIVEVENDSTVEIFTAVSWSLLFQE